MYFYASGGELLHTIVDKIGLLLLCLLSLMQAESFWRPVAVLLIGAVCSEAIQLLPAKKTLYILALYGVLCLLVPSLCLILPLFIYDVLTIKKYPLLVLYAAAFLAGMMSLTAMQPLFILVSSGIAVLLHIRSRTAADLQKRLIEQRDQAEEVHLLLSEKNKHILQQQDNEIYMATLKERNRIAREIHDNVGHSLTRSLLQVGAIQILNKDETLSESISSVKDTLNEAMTSIRSSVHDLHDTTIHLHRTLQECIAPLEERYRIELDCGIPERAPKSVKLCLIGIVKESLSNVVKHSNADTISVVLREHPAFYQLIIRDNGTGNKTIRETGMGLAGMKERAENAGGLLNITPSEKGFQVFASIPKKKQEENPE
ncbi:MAG: sensor histidine kinase [Ruminococcus sp.]|nr:sensor histidine kinase [Ruminococcus sp.]